jgi:ribose transport system ATP-binding protein
VCPETGNEVGAREGGRRDRTAQRNGHRIWSPVSSPDCAQPLNTPVRLLEIRDLVKRFTGTIAVDHADLEVEAGEIHALLGANGAGKSTVIKLLAGVYKPDEGDIYFQGERVDPSTEHLPIAFIHQDLGLIDGLSIAENFGLVMGFPRRRGIIDWDRLAQQTLAALQSIGTKLDPLTLVAALPLAERAMVAIARALQVKDIRLLVLDEPTASLTEADVSRLFATLGILRKQGIGMLYVTHRLDEVFRIADRVSVFRDGRRISTTAVGNTTTDEIVTQIVGREPAQIVSVDRESRSAVPVLELSNAVSGEVGPVSTVLGTGEIVGLVGLRGAGQETIGRLLFGAKPLSRGSLIADGKPVEDLTPNASIRRGVGFVSSERAAESLAASLSVRENIYLSPLISGRHAWELKSRKSERQAAYDAANASDIRPRDPEFLVGVLSGGNQQKVVLARWLYPGRCRLLVLEEPTLGVDVGAKVDIYNSLAAMVKSGLSVVVVSSDFDEVCIICDRAIVFNHGRVVTELTRQQLTPANLIRWASGDSTESEESKW